MAEGGLEHVALYRASLPAALHELRQPIASSAPHPPGLGRDDPTGDRPVALILGNENTGLDTVTLAACDEVRRIPGGGHVQSLNVASAAAILIYLLSGFPSG